jgi:hypothetical protein
MTIFNRKKLKARYEAHSLEMAEHENNRLLEQAARYAPIYAAEQIKVDELHLAGGLASDKTLRDAAALKALRYIMGDERTGSYAHAAAESYEMADAMLEARKTTGGGEA